MRFMFAVPVAVVLLSACASAPTTRDSAGRTDSQLGAAKSACSGKSTGEACTLCAPGDASCVETMELKACDASGACTSQTTPPPYGPCAGKKAGAACTLCDPADSSCVETAVLKACDGGGACR